MLLHITSLVKRVWISNHAEIRNKIFQLSHMGFNKATLGELIIEMPIDCDWIITVETGTINDMTRFF